MSIKYRVYYLTMLHHLRSELFDSLSAVDDFCRARGDRNILHITLEVV